MKRILIATTNPAKLAEYRILLREFSLEVISLRDAGISEVPVESGATFAENARLKARFYVDRARIATLADDGGLEVDALGGAPGVKSHRWLGDRADNSDAALAAEVIRRMQGVPEAARSARLSAALALIFEIDGERIERVAEASMHGVVAHAVHPSIREGFPYRAVMMVGSPPRYLSELGAEAEAALSQRKIALARLDSDLRRIAEPSN